MKIQIERLDDAFHLRARNEAGNTVDMDITEEKGGHGQGIGPMQMTAAALGGCSSIDVIQILQKGRQRIDDYRVEVDYERAKDQVPAVFTHIHVTFHLTGDLDPDKVRRAIQLSITKYCSVSKMLAKTATITAAFSVNGTAYEVDL